MSVPPQPLPPGEGSGQSREVPAWEYPGLGRVLVHFIKRTGSVEVGGKTQALDNGYVEVKGQRYIVLGGIDAPEVGIELPLGINAVFDKSCAAMGDVAAAGKVAFTGPVHVKSVSASSIQFAGDLDSFGVVFAREGSLEGRGDVNAGDVKARDNISVYGDIRGQLVMALNGFLQANSIKGEAILGRLGINALTGGMGYGSDKPTAERPSCMIWCNEGRIYSAKDITTGKICAGQDIQTSDGDLTLVGDAFCLGAKINGRVLDSAGKPAADNVYSRYAWECWGLGDRKSRIPPKEIPEEELVRKLEHSPFAIDRWEKYFTKYETD
ncbi:MAG: hypothetical protein V1875_02505 [Candidatus Altiarchaeota archaeon]